MERKDIVSFLKTFVKQQKSEVNYGTYRETTRSSLLKDGLGTRANSVWKQSQFIVAYSLDDTEEDTRKYLAGWIQLTKRVYDQFLILECPKETWTVYDKNGVEVEMADLKYVSQENSNGEKGDIQKTNLFMEDISTPQTIYYGAPGTGKSHKIKTLHKENVVRTTFHPDSDYSTFIGAYKPTMEEVERYESSGTPIREKRIVYNYVPQAFLRAYTSAWKNYPKPQYLVIEEINRGNCAQIFGDLFQLLDRHETGFSDYPICADSDIQRYLSEEFSKCNFTEIIGEETEAIQEMYAQECPDILNQLQLGNLLLLPKNLYILATMNTSDQSLFPIDSAFKRRWHWEYTPIRNGGKEWTIEANGQHWDWWAFLQAINERIEEVTSSEDKKLGYFFVKAGDKGTSIKASLFVGKVIFYLWNDVYKDYGFDDSIFQDSNGKQMTFPRFYETNEVNEEVNEVLVANFLRNVVGKSIEESHNDEINENKEQ